MALPRRTLMCSGAAVEEKHRFARTPACVCVYIYNTCVYVASHPDEVLGELSSGVLGHVDGRDDPVPLHPPQRAVAPDDHIVQRKQDLWYLLSHRCIIRPHLPRQ